MKRLALPLLVLTSLVVACGLLEVALRIVLPTPTYVLDPDLGWKTAPDLHHTMTQTDAAGADYAVEFVTDAQGRRHYAVDGTAPPISVLVIGDSFTALPFANEPDMWYGVFARDLAQASGRAVAMTVIGAGGYGTLQQLLVAREYAMTGGSADLVVHQFCGNDFINNAPAWEQGTILTNLSGRRPYLDDDLTSIVHSPGPWASILRSPLGELRLIDRVDTTLQQLRAGPDGLYPSPPSDSAKALWREQALQRTEPLLSRLRAVFPTATALMVNCVGPDDDGVALWGLNEQWPQIAKAAGFYPLTDPNQALTDAKAAGQVVRHADGIHFNIAGNRIFGQAAFIEARPALATFLAD